MQHRLDSAATQRKEKAKDKKDEVVASALILRLALRARNIGSAAQIAPAFAAFLIWGEFELAGACYPCRLVVCSTLLRQAVRRHIKCGIGGQGSWTLDAYLYFPSPSKYKWVISLDNFE